MDLALFFISSKSRQIKHRLQRPERGVFQYSKSTWNEDGLSLKGKLSFLSSGAEENLIKIHRGFPPCICSLVAGLVGFCVCVCVFVPLKGKAKHMLRRIDPRANKPRAQQVVVVRGVIIEQRCVVDDMARLARARSKSKSYRMFN